MLRIYFVKVRICFVMLRIYFVTVRICFVMLRIIFVTVRICFVMLRIYFVTVRICFVMLRNYLVTVRIYFVMLRFYFVLVRIYFGAAKLIFICKFYNQKGKLGNIISKKIIRIIVKICKAPDILQISANFSRYINNNSPEVEEFFFNKILPYKFKY